MIFASAVLCGAAAVLLCLTLVFQEAQLRKKAAISRMHTTFKAINCDLPDVELYATQMIIGRRRRRCDISLSSLKDKRISKVHAVLWWDGSGYRIAPLGVLHPDMTTSKPKVWVDMEPVTDPGGAEVNYGSIIKISDGEYKFELVDTSCRAAQGSVREPVVKKPVTRAAARKPAVRTAARRRIPRALFTVVAVVLLLALTAGLVSGIRSPSSGTSDSLGERKKDTATFLVCGVDKSGLRTDTIMLVYVSGSEKQIGIMSIPRDTITVTENGKYIKLNAAYAGNGEQGAQALMDHVSKYIGYRPDGYLLFDWDLVIQLTDLMGGVDVELDHYIRVETDGVECYVPEGQQHLNGEQVLAALRYRAGYYNADLGRVAVQRKVLAACASQWVSLDKLTQLPGALELLTEKAVTDLSAGNLLWIAKTVFFNKDSISSNTLPGYAEYRNGVSYYVLSPRKIAELVNESYNPYLGQIEADMLDTVP